MKNILSSLNESEKKRILEMHYNATNRQYLAENPTGTTKTTTGATTKQGGTIAQTPQTPPGNPSKFSTPGIYYTTAPNGTSIGVNNTEYKKQDWQDLGGSGRVYLYGQDPKTGKWNISYGSVSCNTGQIDGKNSKSLGAPNEVIEYVSNNFCGEVIGKEGRMIQIEPSVTVSTGTYPIKTVWKRKNNVTAVWKERWFTDPLALISCSAKEVGFTDKYKKTPGFKELSPKDIKTIETALLSVCS